MNLIYGLGADTGYPLSLRSGGWVFRRPVHHTPPNVGNPMEGNLSAKSVEQVANVSNSQYPCCFVNGGIDC